MTERPAPAQHLCSHEEEAGRSTHTALAAKNLRYAIMRGKVEHPLQAGNRTAITEVTVMKEKILPHFSKSGEFLKEYSAGRSVFMRSLFNCEPTDLNKDPRLAAAFRSAAINTLDRSL